MREREREKSDHVTPQVKTLQWFPTALNIKIKLLKVAYNILRTHLLL